MTMIGSTDITAIAILTPDVGIWVVICALLASSVFSFKNCTLFIMEFRTF